MSDLVKSEGKRIERGIGGVKLAVVIGQVEEGVSDGRTYLHPLWPLYYVDGVGVGRDDFNAVVAMLSIVGGRPL